MGLPLVAKDQKIFDTLNAKIKEITMIPRIMEASRSYAPWIVLPFAVGGIWRLVGGIGHSLEGGTSDKNTTPWTKSVMERRKERMQNEKEDKNGILASDNPKTIFEKNLSPGLRKHTS